MKIFATRNLPPKGIELLQKAGIELTIWTEQKDLPTAELLEKIKGYDGLICIGPYKLDKSFFEQCQHLKVISLLSVGFDNVDVPASISFKIPIGNTPGVLSKATADTAFLLLQMVARKAIFNYTRIVNGQWGFYDPTADLGVDLEGKKLGIVGLGRIGLEMARKCKAAFNMPIIYHNRSKNAAAENELGARLVSFEELLQESDIISIHAALTDETKSLFGKKEFEAMKTNAILINTARGAMIDEPALIEALQSNTIWGAGLDVTNPEPMQADSPLLTLPNAAVLPHIGSATVETRNEMARLAAENIIAGLKGEHLPYCINPEIYQQ